MLGGQLGYNFQFGRVVAGAEADISFGQVKDFIRDGNYLTYNGKLTQMGTIRGRLGYDFNGFMPYITAGWMWNRLEQGSTCPAGAPFPVVTVCNVGQFNVASTQTFSGFTIGGGAEYALSRNWSLKGEVLFSNLGKQEYSATLPVFGNVTTSVNQDLSYVARMGVNYRF